MHHHSHVHPGFLSCWPAPRDLLLLAYWPVYLLLFLFVEWLNPPQRCHMVQCWLDDLIPFCELFVIPYLLWFVLLAWMTVYTLFRAPEVFRQYMHFIIPQAALRH